MSKELTRAERIEMLEHDISATEAEIRNLKMAESHDGKTGGGQHADTEISTAGDQIEILLSGDGGKNVKAAGPGEECEITVERRREIVNIKFRFSDSDDRADVTVDLEAARRIAEALAKAAR